ncbi:MAG TPA: energy transducer TonB [Pedobacter sp.]
MHQIEKQALEDPFVAQALAGLSESPKRASASVSLLQKQLYDRIAQQQVSKKESVFTWQRLSVAAAAAVMFISVSIFFFMRDQETRRQQVKAYNGPKRVDVNLAPSPSAIDSAKEVAYAANTPVKTAGSNTVGMIGPERQKQIERQPVTSAFVQTEDLKKTAAVPAGVQKAITTVIADTTRAADNQAPAAKVAAVSARVTTVLPAVSVPVGGWASLDNYLTDNNKLSKDKSGKFVELSFLIDKDGRPSDIKVIKGAAPEFDAEAIRLIKEGPKWEQPKSADSRVSYTIAF